MEFFFFFLALFVIIGLSSASDRRLNRLEFKLQFLIERMGVDDRRVEAELIEAEQRANEAARKQGYARARRLASLTTIGTLLGIVCGVAIAAVSGFSTLVGGAFGAATGFAVGLFLAIAILVAATTSPTSAAD